MLLDNHTNVCKGDEEPLCRSGECILRENLCDLKFQCHDKSDEMNCSKYSARYRILHIYFCMMFNYSFQVYSRKRSVKIEK